MLSTRTDRSIRFLLGASTFLGGILLFLIEPLIAKWILPWFGGGASVWTTCMLFFQGVLLTGYLYAHLTTRYLSVRAQGIVHCLVLLGAVATLPAIPPASLRPVDASWPALRCMLVLLASIGLPFFVLSTTSTLAQAWWSRLVPRVPPYRLYAVSNLASLLGLLAYPLGFELLMGLRAQAYVWSAAVVIFVLLCGLCAVLASQTSMAGAIGPGLHHDAPLGWRPAGWIAWPACSSLLLLAVTATLSQSVAPIPFLWVLPLAIYLISFVICFSYPAIYRRDWTMVGFALALAAVCALLIGGPMARSLAAQVSIYCVLLFLACMVCHGELYRLRPAACRLAAFYLAIAAGGVLGGVMAALVAPWCFSGIWELHVAAGAIGLLSIATLWMSRDSSLRLGRPALAWFAISLFATATGAVLWMDIAGAGLNQTIARYRSFYGAMSVRTIRSNSGGELTALQHGGIIHGIEARTPQAGREPLGYYGADSGLGRLMRATAGREGRKIGIVGLGAGAMSAWAIADDRLVFYELNPQVTRVAKEHFTFLKTAACPVEIIEGDARISLERQSPQQFDLLVLDAFNGDAVPMHLLTREAIDIYKRHLKADGVIAFHITNRHVDLQPVIARIAEYGDWESLVVATKPTTDDRYIESDWAILARGRGLFGRVEFQNAGGPARPRSNVPLWTDDRSNLLRILR